MMSMNEMKKMISSHKAYTCMAFTAMGAAMGMIAAKMVIKECCCGSEMLKCKAKKALKTMEDML